MSADKPHWLTIRTPGADVTEFPLGERSIVIGRSAACDLTLESPYVSRQHLRLDPQAEDWMLTNLSRTNPVVVNGQRVEGQRVLRPGDEIHVADIALEFQSTQDPGATQVFEAVGNSLGFETGGTGGVARVRGLLGPGSTRGTLSVMFTDLENSTSVSASLGDVRAQEYRREHDQLLRGEFERFGGAEVKGFGDGFLVAFGSASAAAHCAVAIQQRLDAYNQAHPLAIRVRIGLNVGEVFVEDDDIFGTAVVVASRVMSQAHGGEIYLSELMNGVLEATGEFTTHDLGPAQLKGIDEPQEIFKLEWDTVQSGSAPHEG